VVSQLKVNEIIKQSGSTLTIGQDGDTVSGPFTNTPAFLVSRSGSNQQINDETYTTVAFNNVLLDTDSGYSTSTYKYTIPTTGKYYIFYSIYGYSPSNTDGLERFYVRLFKNSDVQLAQSYYDQRNNPGYIYSNQMSHIESLSANDTIYVQAFIDVTNGVADPEIGGSSTRAITSFGAYRLIGA